jgi:hypothetical protein
VAGSRKRVTLTAAQKATESGTDLLDLLVEITADGELTVDEIARLGHWLADNGDAVDVPAVAFLREVVERIVADGRIDLDERLDLAVAIERVLPKEQRLSAKEQRKRVAKVTAVETGSAPSRWGRDPATEPQIKYLRALGASIPPGLTKQQASDLLDHLVGSRASVSNRQMMVLRFWDCLYVADTGRRGVSAWMDDFYAEDQDRPAAWEWWKEENGDVGRQDPPEKVPIGIGPTYLARVKARAGASRRSGASIAVGARPMPPPALEAAMESNRSGAGRIIVILLVLATTAVILAIAVEG